MGLEKIILCSFLITIISLLSFTGNNTELIDFVNQLKNFPACNSLLPEYYLVLIVYRNFSFLTVILND